MFNSNASAVSGDANYIEDVFSTYLYTGNGTSQTITNGIDLSTEGGLVWIKDRTLVENHNLFDTARGAGYSLISNETGGQGSFDGQRLSAFTTSGFSVGSRNAVNINASKFASWSFREQPKFFDVVTYTGTGSNTTVAHALGSVPGCIIVKRTDTASDWQVYHRSLANTEYLVLNTTAAKATGATRWNSTTPTSTVFSVGTDASVNASGGTYVAYLWAHDAGGFGLSGADNVISCGSLNTGAGGTSGRVNLGWEPQFVIIKRTNITEGWMQFDNMRGLGVLYTANKLNPNTDGGEGGPGADECFIDSTGFTVGNVGNSQDFVYIVIRRGPMKVPTLGTSVFGATAWSGAGSTTFNLFAPDWATRFQRNATNATNTLVSTRLTGEKYLITSSTAAEVSDDTITFDNAAGGAVVSYGASGTLVSYFYGRAPGFFDVVCYTGTGSATTFSHNLGVAPELMIVKIRNQAGAAWAVYNAASGNTKVIRLNTTAAETTSSAYWNNTSPTSSVFTVGNDGDVNNSSDTYVSYLFATCAGVSKVGSYTGTATTLQIDCGFTGGARFVLIKRTDSTGDWYVWDSARGIIAGDDPYLLLNSTAAEVTNTDYVDTAATGFELTSTAPAAINASGGTYIFLAIA
jgi:hypothetical protein